MKKNILFICLYFVTGMVFSQGIPNFQFNTMDGKQSSISNLLEEGPVLIDFWALWCAPCLKEMRHLNEFQEFYEEKGLTVLMVNLDTERSRAKVRAYVKSKNYQFLVAMDPSQNIYRQLSGTALPYTLLIDKSGEITYKHTGYMPGDEEILEENISKLFVTSDSTLTAPESEQLDEK